MVHNGNRYSEEFKRQIIDLYLSGKPVKELADEYGLVEKPSTNGRSYMQQPSRLMKIKPFP